MAVVAAFEFHNLVASGEAAGRTDGAHRRLGTAIHHADHLHARHQIHHEFRELGFQAARGAETESVLRRLGHRLDNGVMGMSQEHWAPAAHVIDVIVTVHVVDMAALGTGDKRRRRPHVSEGTHRAVHAARHQVLGFGKKLFANGMVHFSRPFSKASLAW